MMPKGFMLPDLQREMALLIARCNDIRTRLVITQRQVDRQQRQIEALRRRIDASKAKRSQERAA